MVYYIKAMAKDFTSKVVLPMALTAGIASTASAATNFTVVSDTDHATATGFGISADEVLLVGINLNQTAGEQIQAVEAVIQLPDGLALVEGTFAPNEERLPAGKFNVNFDALGGNKYRLLIYSPSRTAITSDNGNLVTFQVKANRNLVNGSTIDINLTDVITTDNVNVANGIQSTVVTRQYDLPGVNLIPAIAGFDLNPGEEMTVEVPFNNDAEIHGLKSTIKLPAGLELVVPESGDLNDAFVQGSRIASVALAAGYNAGTGLYTVVIGSGAFGGNSGTLFSFKVKAKSAADWKSTDPEDIQITTFELSDKYGVAHDYNEVVNIPVSNPNAKAYVTADAAVKAIETAYNTYKTTDADFLLYQPQVTTQQAAADAAVTALRTAVEAAYAAGTLATNPVDTAEPAEVQALKDAVAAAKGANASAYTAADAAVKATEDAYAAYIAEDADYLKYAGQVTAEKAAADAAVAAQRAAVEAGNTAGTLATNPVDTAEPAAVQALKDAVAAAKAANDGAYTAGNTAVKATEDAYAAYIAENADYLKYADQVTAEKAAADAAVAAQRAALEAGNTAGTLATNPVYTAEPAEVQALKDAVAAAKAANDAAYTAADAAVKAVEDAYADYLADDADYNKYAAQVTDEKAAADAAVTGLREAVNEGNAAGTLATEPVDLTAADDEIAALQQAVADAKQANDDAKVLSDAMALVLDGAFNDAVAAIDPNVAADAEVVDAQTAAAQAIQDYKNAVATADEQGRVALDAAALNALYTYAQDAITTLSTVADNHETAFNDNATNQAALEGQVEALQDALNDAQEALDDLKNDNEFISDDVVAAIQDQINDVQSEIDNLSDAIEAAGADRGLADDDAVQTFVDAIVEQLDAINAAEGITDQIADAQADYDQNHKAGDVNHDIKVNITDYFWIIDYYLGKVATPAEGSEDFKRADLNGDGEIDGVDAVRMVNIILNQSVSAARGEMSAADESLTMTSTRMGNGIRRYALNLNSSNAYVAAQMDIVLPEGMKVVGEQLSNRANGHDLMSADVNGAHRIFIGSQQNSQFTGAEGAVLYIDVQGEGELEFQNVALIDEAANGHQMNVMAGGEATAISGTSAVTAVKETVYNMGGRVMNALKKGINIIRRADGSTQKVVVK